MLRRAPLLGIPPVPIPHNPKGRTAMKDDELLMPSQVARIFHVDPKTVTRWARAGKINSIRTLGGHRRFYRSEVERAIAEALDDNERQASH